MSAHVAQPQPQDAAPEAAERPQRSLRSTGSQPVDLTGVTARYWFTKDATNTAVVSYCDYAYLDCTPNGKVTHRIGTMSPARFKGGTLAPASNANDATTWDVQLRLHKEDWSNFDEKDDYSYGTNDFQD
jgi:Cellulose binding domain